MDVAEDKGASHWLSALPLAHQGFTLHKGAFRDALYLRYDCRPSNLPSCCVCGQDFSIDHAMICPTGGFPTIRHNEVRDITATLLREVCPEVSVEPILQPLSGETMCGLSANCQPEARLDISARGFWGDHSFFDVRVFHPNARSNRHPQLSATYARHEQDKRRQYAQRVIDVKQSSFTPLVLSTAGGMGRAATATYRRLASLLSDKMDQPFSVVLNWLRCRLSFALLRSAEMCLRGCRTRVRVSPLDLLPALEAADTRQLRFS